MTSSAKTPGKKLRGVPEHGSESRYRGSQRGSWEPCRCDPCRAAYVRACKRRALDHLRGRTLLFPVAVVMEHVRMLNETGMNTLTVARRSGVSHSTISYWARGLTKTCQRPKALAVMAVQPGDFDGRGVRPVVPVRRRAQALYAVGHGPADIAAAVGLHERTVSSIANGHTTWVDQATEDALMRAYASLRNESGPSDQARRRAKRQGWHDPVWWDDMESIDDVLFDEAEADRLLNRELKRDELGAMRRQEIEHLASSGCVPDRIAARIGVDETTVRTVLQELRTGQRRVRKQVAA